MRIMQETAIKLVIVPRIKNQLFLPKHLNYINALLFEILI